MCTAISARPGDCYFGRNLDLELSYGEQVVITPRNYLFHLSSVGEYRNRYALLGMAAVVQDVPLYYEAANEKGLTMAGLNFPKSAVFRAPEEDMYNVELWHLLPWVLGQSETLAQARALLERTNLSNPPGQFNSPQHFMLSDRTGSIVVEPGEQGFVIYDDPYDVMTNEPPFQYHMWNMRNYRGLSPDNGESRFTDRYPLDSYAVGMGAMGLPGDTSSASRFVRAAFNLANSHWSESEAENVGQIFHVLDSVAMVKGCTRTEDGKDDITRYSSCINATRGIYYYTTYGNRQITAIDLHKTDLEGAKLTCYPLVQGEQICAGN